MAVLIASALDKDIAGRPLFSGVSLKLERGDRLTLSGRNGSGKTTLLRVLAGQASFDGGELTVSKGVRVVLHDQRPPRERGLSLRDYVLAGCSELVALEEELTRLEQAMADGAHDQRTLDRYAKAQSRLEHAGGYGWRERVLDVVKGLGFEDSQLDRPLEGFSGGELTRASLARALAGAPDLLLLDEPTNHLDINSLEWLEKYLMEIDAAVVLVAHDRWFLEAVGTSVLELEAGRARFFSGPWHAWRTEKAARELALGRAIDKQEAEIARMERFVERFRAKASKARQAQSRVKKLDKMERISGDPKDGKSLSFSFAKAERSGKVVFELVDGRLEVGGRTLLDSGELWLERGEHVALVGANGSGKTTLLNALTDRRPLDGGKLSRGHNVTLGYLSQHAEELDEHGSALEAAQRATGLPPNKTRALLGRFLFSGRDAEKPISGLSGGERQRLSLAILVSSGANLLVLDEPTNHLDVESREALEDALGAYDGTLLLVSHDRALLDAVGTRLIAFEDEGLHSYVGGWPEYQRKREEEEQRPGAAVKARKAESSNGGGREKTAEKQKPAKSKNAQRREGQIEQAIAAAESALATLEDELADPASWATPERSADSTKRHAAAQRAVKELYAELERLAS
jgi:ATP-binding cassette subfamily F protein 3